MTITAPNLTDPRRVEYFENLVRTHATAIGRYLRRRISPLSPGDVDDLLAETLVVVWRRLDDVPAGAELAWMVGAARRVLANAQRSHRRRVVRETSALATQPGTESVVVADVSLAYALEALSDDEREILLATVWDGLSVDDLAELYGVSQNAIALRISRARAHFLDAFNRT